MSSECEWLRSCTYPRMHKCPLCDSQNIRISYSKKIRDYFFKWFLNRVPFLPQVPLTLLPA